MRLVTVKKFSRVDESSATMSNAAAAEVIDAHLAALEGEPRPLVPVDAALSANWRRWPLSTAKRARAVWLAVH